MIKIPVQVRTKKMFDRCSFLSASSQRGQGGSMFVLRAPLATIQHCMDQIVIYNSEEKSVIPYAYGEVADFPRWVA